MSAIRPNTQRVVEQPSQPQVGSPAFYARQQEIDTLDTANGENANRATEQESTFTSFVNFLTPVFNGVLCCLAACFYCLFEAAQKWFQGEITELAEREQIKERQLTPAEDPDEILAATQRSTKPYHLLSAELAKWTELSKKFPAPCAVTAVVKIVTKADEKAQHFILQEQYTAKKLPNIFDIDVQGLRDQTYHLLSELSAVEDLAIDLIAVQGESQETCRYFYQTSRFLGDGFTNFTFTEASKKTVHHLVTTGAAFESARYDGSKVFWKPQTTG